MKSKTWFVRFAVSLMVALPAPIVLAAALSLVSSLKNNTIGSLLDGQVSSTEFIAYISIAFAVGVLVMLSQVIAEPIAAQFNQDDREDQEGPEELDDREEGEVKWFNVSKGFGFVTRENGEDVFVHFRSIRGSGHRSLQEGQRVLFGVVESSKGLQAEDVSILRQK